MKYEHLDYRESPPKRFQLASFMDRGIAFIIDIVLFEALLAVLFIVIQLLKLPKNWFSSTFNFYASILTFFLFILANTVSEFYWGATPGKKMLRIKAIDFIGEKPSFNNIVLRTLIKYASFGSSSLIIPFTNKQQGLHDTISGTIIVKMQLAHN